MATPAEAAAMRRAIALSAAGLGTTSPNPPVGCVLLDTRGRIVGEGYHVRKGEAHAEAQALAAAGPLATGATAVVTLEPCNHQGRTPACRQALIDAGVRRAVIAVIDPTSRGEGGTAALRQAGVDVETGVLAAEAQVVLGGWLSGITNRRPVITWPYLVGGHGIEALPADTSEARLLRLNADAVLRADGSVRPAGASSCLVPCAALSRDPADKTIAPTSDPVMLHVRVRQDRSLPGPRGSGGGPMLPRPTQKPGGHSTVTKPLWGIPRCSTHSPRPRPRPRARRSSPVPGLAVTLLLGLRQRIPDHDLGVFSKGLSQVAGREERLPVRFRSRRHCRAA
jgi:pyrimidine deaminase RibD-like protein